MTIEEIQRVAKFNFIKNLKQYYHLKENDLIEASIDIKTHDKEVRSRLEAIVREDVLKELHAKDVY